MKQIIAMALAGIVLVVGIARVTGNAEGDQNSMPRIVQKDGRWALLVDGEPFLMLGAQVNNSSAWPAELPKVWPAMEILHVNTVEIPVYWEQMEPREGEFDFSVVDALLAGAREHRVRLVLLWFGTWKNGSNHYMPGWRKLQPQRYPNSLGADGKEVDSPSPFAEETLKADEQAFAALMGHLKEADQQHTVIMVQVENEPGIWQGVRDYGASAQKAFNSAVPGELVANWKEVPKTGATWREVFGAHAEEVFSAWSVSHYIGQVAAAGKAVWPVPMYVNAQLRDPLPKDPAQPPGYEHGGATDDVIWVWKAAAPALDLVAPDIYWSDYAKYMKLLELYHREDNALMIPETGHGADYARYCFAAVGKGAIGFSPFGLDFTRYADSPIGASSVTEATLAPFALNYLALGKMAREVARLNFEGKVQGVAENAAEHAQKMEFDGWDLTVSYGAGGFGREAPKGNAQPIGRALVAQLGADEFLMTGFFCRVDFQPGGAAADKPWQYLRVEEGAYENGAFKAEQTWNGDQTDLGLNFSSGAAVLRVEVMMR